MRAHTVVFMTVEEISEHLNLEIKKTRKVLDQLGLRPWDFDGVHHYPQDYLAGIMTGYSNATPAAEAPDEWIRVAKVAELLNLPSDALEQYSSSGFHHDLVRRKQGGVWLYSLKSVEACREKRSRVDAEGLMYTNQIERVHGISQRRLRHFALTDSAFFPRPVFRLAGHEYYQPAEVLQYFEDQAAYLALPSVSDLAKAAGVSQQHIYRWFAAGHLPTPLNRFAQLRISKDRWETFVAAAIAYKNRPKD